MKNRTILTLLFILNTVMFVQADGWARDVEPAVLEVYYTRTEVYDTARSSDYYYFSEETMLRIGKGMSNSNFGARMAAMFGKVTPGESGKKRNPDHDKEERDYPHDL